MGIIEILLEEVSTKGADLAQQIREICDKITEQEQPKMKYPQLAPKGSMVFLCIEAPGRYSNEIGFLTLEREDEEKYLIVHHSIEEDRINKEDIENSPSTRRRKVWEVNEHKPEKILKQFARVLKLLRGE